MLSGGVVRDSNEAEYCLKTHVLIPIVEPTRPDLSLMTNMSRMVCPRDAAHSFMCPVDHSPFTPAWAWFEKHYFQ